MLQRRSYVPDGLESYWRKRLLSPLGRLAREQLSRYADRETWSGTVCFTQGYLTHSPYTIGVVASRKQGKADFDSSRTGCTHPAPCRYSIGTLPGSSAKLLI